MQTLCRDCHALSDGHWRRCAGCGSGRTLAHPALARLTIAHIDCDAFFAAIEKRDDPSLKPRPVIVGGGKRGVVSTCCYIARLSGVRSAMPMFKALKACPDAVVIKPDMARYGVAAQQIRDKMTALTPLVQSVSIDEAYLDLSGTQILHGAPPAAMLARLASEIERDVGITVSIGLSGNRFLAKTASEMDKPRGFAVIAPEEAPALLRARAPADLHGVGPKLAARLARDGFDTVSDLQDAGRKQLVARYGETGLYLHERSLGIDPRPVEPHSERKSVSSETTFETDISDPDELTDLLWRVCEKTAIRAKKAGMEGTTVTLKLKTGAFRTLTRRTTLPEATQLAGTLFRTAQPLLERELAHTRAYRLIGVGLSGLQAARGDASDLIDPGIAKRAAAERASDAARERFGEAAVQSARALRWQKTRNKR